MADAYTVIKRGLLQGDLDFNGFKPLNIDLTDIISQQFGVQSANRFFAGPSSGAAANPAFRAMVAADLPASAMLTTQNLAGLASAATSRANLGLTSTAVAANTTTGLQLLAIAPPALEGVNFLRSNDGQPEWTTPATVLSTIGAEPALGNPGTNGFVLSSTTGGVRSWVAQSAATLPVVDSTAVVKGSADATKLLRFEVDGFTTGTTRVLTPPNFDGTIATLAGIESLTNKTLNNILFSADAGPHEVIFKGAVTFTGEDGTILRAPVASDVTLPATGTLATLAGVETFTNKLVVNGNFQGGVFLKSDTALFYQQLTTDDTDDIAGQSLTFRMQGGQRILSLGGHFETGGDLTLSGAFDATLTITADSTLTLPTSGTLATRENAEILANKTLEAIPRIGIVNATSGFDINVLNTDTTAVADKNLSLNLHAGNRTIDLSGNLTLANSLSTVGAFTIALTATATTALTLPTAGTVEAYVGVPASAAAAGVAGQKAYDASFEYRCVATNTWKRVAIATW